MCGKFLVNEKPPYLESFHGMKNFPHIWLERKNSSNFCGTVEDVKKYSSWQRTVAEALKK